MPAWPDAPAVRAFLTRVSRRLTWLAAAEGAAAGLVVATGLLAAGWVGRGSVLRAVAAGVVLAIAGLAIGVMRAGRSRRRPSDAVERRVQAFRNVLITAAELIDRPGRVRESIGARVCQDAARLATTIDLGRVFPARRAAVVTTASVTLWIAMVGWLGGRPVTASNRAGGRDAAVISHIDVTVTPPGYAGRAAESFRDPARITALAGSRLRIVATADAATVALETIGGRATLAPSTGGAFAGEVIADADGYLAIEPMTTAGTAGARRLIGLTVEADRSPRVRVTAPGKDLFLPDARRTIDLRVEADDDLALGSLGVRYTKVAGSGENFTFTEGEVPLEIARTDARTWNATGTLRLPALELSQGDLVVYRAVAADRRPGAAPVESDSWVVEIVGPGAVAMEGFAVDDDRDRYALSQQMVIIKTEQLVARRPTLTADAFADEADNIAAEQRRVRAEFVFMMGGEFADAGLDTGQLNEEEEAAGESDLAAGRLVNQGRNELIRAIRSMSHAATALTAKDTKAALVDERAALASLQKAFARSRYILRTLTERERLDLSRRLTGVLAALVRDVRPLPQAPDNPRLSSLRQSLASLATLASAETFSAADAVRATTIAQEILRTDPSDPALAQVAASLTEAAPLMSARPLDARARLDTAATALAGTIRTALSDGPGRDRATDLARLGGLLADALKRATK